MIVDDETVAAGQDRKEPQVSFELRKDLLMSFVS